jgi:dihydroorotase
MSTAPAKIFHLPGGSLRKGSVGDVTVFNPDTDWKVDPKKFVSKGRNTPYGGRELRGKVHYTIVGGRVVHKTAQG